jgi:hypothetical protein
MNGNKGLKELQEILDELEEMDYYSSIESVSEEYRYSVIIDDPHSNISYGEDRIIESNKGYEEPVSLKSYTIYGEWVESFYISPEAA